MKKIFSIFVVAMVTLVAVLPAEASSKPEPHKIADSMQCLVRCNDCNTRCNNNKSCNENCYDMSATCCEAIGRKPVYKGCGCF